MLLASRIWQRSADEPSVVRFPWEAELGGGSLAPGIWRAVRGLRPALGAGAQADVLLHGNNINV